MENARFTDCNINRYFSIGAERERGEERSSESRQTGSETFVSILVGMRGTFSEVDLERQ